MFQSILRSFFSFFFSSVIDERGKAGVREMGGGGVVDEVGQNVAFLLLLVR